MSDQRHDGVAVELGEPTLRLLRSAADHWAAGDERGAERLAAVAWRVVGQRRVYDKPDAGGREAQR